LNDAIVLVNVLGVDATGKSTLASHLADRKACTIQNTKFALDRLDEFSSCFVGQGLVESIHGTNLGLRLSGDAVSRIADTMAILADCTFSLEVALGRVSGPSVLVADRGFPGHIGIQAVRIADELGIAATDAAKSLLDLYSASLGLARRLVPHMAIVELDVHLVADEGAIGERNVARGRPAFSETDWRQLRASRAVNDALLEHRAASGIATTTLDTTRVSIREAGDEALAHVARLVARRQVQE
jgi:hypothetical protein